MGSKGVGPGKVGRWGRGQEPLSIRDIGLLKVEVYVSVC